VSEVIETAGLAKNRTPATDLHEARREVIRAARAALRRADATDDEWDDALEALVELSKE